MNVEMDNEHLPAIAARFFTSFTASYFFLVLTYDPMYLWHIVVSTGTDYRADYNMLVKKIFEYQSIVGSQEYVETDISKYKRDGIMYVSRNMAVLH